MPVSCGRFVAEVVASDFITEDIFMFESFQRFREVLSSARMLHSSMYSYILIHIEAFWPSWVCVREKPSEDILEWRNRCLAVCSRLSHSAIRRDNLVNFYYKERARGEDTSGLSLTRSVRIVMLKRSASQVCGERRRPTKRRKTRLPDNQGESPMERGKKSHVWNT